MVIYSVTRAILRKS